MSSTELANTSSIFQLALGVNAVFAVLLNHYLRYKNELVRTFAARLNEYSPSFNAKGREKHIAKYLFRATIGYKVIHFYFIVCVVFALGSAAVSFYFLLRAALVPKDYIPNKLLILLSIVTLVINPVLYFCFFKASELFLNLIRERLQLKAEMVQLVEICIKVSETTESTNELVARLQLNHIFRRARGISRRIKASFGK